MKKRINFKKIILSCFTAICLGLGITAPFINSRSDIVVNASSTNSITCDYNGFTYYQIIHELDGSESFLTLSSVPVESALPIQNSNNTKFDITNNTDFLSDLTDAYYVYYSNVGFGDTYGFTIPDIVGFFNGFMFESDGSVYLADISVSEGRIYVTDEHTVNDLTFYCTYSSTDSIQENTFYYGSNISQPTFLNYFYNSLLFYNNGNYDLSKWGSGSVITFNFANIFDYIDYFVIERDLYSFTGAYGFTSSGNIILENKIICREGLLTNYYYMKSYTDSLFKFNNLSLDECSFIYSLISFNPYPNNPSIYVTSTPDYYRLNKLYNLESSINLNTHGAELFLIPTFDNTININILNLDTDTGIIDYNNSFPIYNKYSRIFYSPFSVDGNYFTFNLNDPFDISCFSLNQLLNIGTSYVALPQVVKGWYTFDLAPFDSITERIDVDLDISFTADSNGYNNLRIIAGTIQGTYVGTIYFRNLDSSRNVINEYVPYQYSRLPYSSDWTTFNARQLFFDETSIDGTIYNTLNQLGVFTFISNNPNNQQSMVDLFWGIAEVPIVTLRKVFDFEILGTNVTNFIMSMITISLILFLIRRLF